MKREVWQAIVYKVPKESHTLSDYTRMKGRTNVCYSFFFSPHALAPEQATLQNSDFMEARQNIHFLLSFHWKFIL